MLIAIEGLDASGKNTQAKLLFAKFKEQGVSVTLFSFPRYGETLFSQAVANYLNGDWGDVHAVDPHFSALLFAGDRFESREKLLDALNTYRVVILDRYVGSNLAYQAAKLNPVARKDFIQWLSKIEYEVFNLPKVDLTLYLDVPVETVTNLIYQRGKRKYTQKQADIHESNVAYLASCVESYQLLAQMESDSVWLSVECIETDGNLQSSSEISSIIWNKIQGFIKAKFTEV